MLSPARPGRQRVGGVPGYLRHNSSRYHTATELHPKSYDWRTLLLPIGVLLLLPTDVLWMIRSTLGGMGKRFVLQSGVQLDTGIVRVIGSYCDVYSPP